MTRPERPLADVFRTPPPRLFAIVSWGAAATHWLSKVLNAHPEVLCIHNAINPWTRLAKTRRIDDVTYIEIIAALGRGYAAAGDCHAVWATSIPKLEAKWKDRFRAAAVVRHPVPRIGSLWSLATRLGFHYYKLDYRHLRRTAPRRLTWIKTEEHLFFLHAARMANSIIAESKVGPVYGMESLTTDRDEVRRLLRHLSADELDFDPSALRSVFEQRLVSHSGAETSKEPRAAFDALKEWQREIFAAEFDPAAREMYERLGYDFSFL